MNDGVFFFKAEYQKKDEAVFIPHIYQSYIISRALRKGGVRFEYTKGFNPRPKMRFVYPLSVGVSGENELFFFFSENTDFDLDQINQTLPRGLVITDISEFGNSKFSEGDVTSAVFEIMLKKTYNSELKFSHEGFTIEFEEDEYFRVRYLYDTGLKFWDMIQKISGGERFENVAYINRLELCYER